ncbi:hypothetical protein Lalb_Chr01g0020111 [Lupinus albus]|uniref:Uncharacterized protein n=1 Tax=Lupinus albus TaxID=3870 RepID=A0A6A4R8J5_LUPAL|nr:hypothetical protein Lalb_Chr01g0020111 [Lupinus albus]
MKEFPSCLGENGVQVADSSSSSATRAAQNVTCVYQCKLRAKSSSCLITVSWTKTLMGQGLSVGIDETHLWCKGSVCDKGQVHEVRIEYDTVGLNDDPCLVIRIDSKTVMQLSLGEITLDVHNWLFGNAMGGNAVLMFQTFISKEKVLAGEYVVSDPSLLTWAYSQQSRDS